MGRAKSTTFQPSNFAIQEAYKEKALPDFKEKDLPDFKEVLMLFILTLIYRIHLSILCYFCYMLLVGPAAHAGHAFAHVRSFQASSICTRVENGRCHACCCGSLCELEADKSCASVWQARTQITS